mmetsp:Transcript_29498/g.41286  ORF Transcript_29498/g.41286 Transcript_29498/m.41286 type:complete len:562 (+) Transcript_29498:2575-4260(+)
MADNVDGCCTEHMIFFIRQSLGRRHDDTVTSVNSQRIKVLHVTDGDTVVLRVAYNFVFNFLPSLHTPFNEDLRRNRKSLLTHILEHFFIVTDSTSKSTKGESGTNHERVANLFSSFNSLIKSLGGVRFGDLFVDLVQLVRENLSVFSVNDSLDLSTENFNAVFFEGTCKVHFNSTVQSGLTTHRNYDTIGLLLLDYFFDEVRCDWKEEHMISFACRFVIHIGLYRCNIRVHKDNFLAFLFEGLDSLSTGVIEFSSLSNGGSTATKKKDFLNIRLGRGRLSGRENNLVSWLSARLQKCIKHEFGISGTTGSFWVKLSTEIRSSLVGNTFVTSVVGIGKKSFPARLQGRTVDVVSVVLRCDICLTSLVVKNRLILTTVAEWKLFGSTSCSKTSQLVSETNTEDWLNLVIGATNDLFELLDCDITRCRVTWTVGEKQTIKLVHFCSKWIVPWDNGQFYITLDKLSDNVVLHTTINGNDLVLISLSINFDFLGTDFIHQMSDARIVGVNHLRKIWWWCIEVNFNPTQKGTLFTDFLSKHTGINITEPRYSFFLEPISETGCSVPM